MKSKISSTVCMGLLMAGVVNFASAADHQPAKPANYDVINMSFSNSAGDSIDYSFSSYFVEGVDWAGQAYVEWFQNFDSAVFDIGGVTTVYNTGPDYNLVLGYNGNSYFAVYEGADIIASSTLLNQMYFDGEMFFVDGGLVDTIVYSGGSYLGSDFVIENSAYLLSDWGSFSMDTLAVTTVSAVPVPAAVWLFGSGLVGLIGIARRRRT